MKLKVLLLGSGGREHAIAWKLAQSDMLEKMYAAPGSPGIADYAELCDIDIENSEEVISLSKKLEIDLVVIGPEAPLASGVSDDLRSAGFRVFGPNKNAARLEWDKAFSKDFMHRNNIPTAQSKTFTSETLPQAKEFLRLCNMPIVLKASGLAAGKGVIIAEDLQTAIDSLEDMLNGAFGSAGSVVVIEEFMKGEEASIFAVTDGVNYVTLAAAQDHKRIGEGDTGANTGGMGAYAPAPVVSPEVMRIVEEQIIKPVLRCMNSEGNIYSGCLYVGLMIDKNNNKQTPDVRVVEFNSRFGDPETQVVLPILQHDLLELFYQAATSTIPCGLQVSSSGNAVTVIMASGGYPANYAKGFLITGIEKAEEIGAKVFHAGTKKNDENLVTNGGRVLAVTTFSADENLENIIEKNYEAVAKINFEGAVFRKDIGHRALKKSPC